MILDSGFAKLDEYDKGEKMFASKIVDLQTEIELHKHYRREIIAMRKQLEVALDLITHITVY